MKMKRADPPFLKKRIGVNENSNSFKRNLSIYLFRIGWSLFPSLTLWVDVVSFDTDADVNELPTPISHSPPLSILKDTKKERKKQERMKKRKIESRKGEHTGILLEDH